MTLFVLGVTGWLACIRAALANHKQRSAEVRCSCNPRRKEIPPLISCYKKKGDIGEKIAKIFQVDCPGAATLLQKILSTTQRKLMERWGAGMMVSCWCCDMNVS